jgi:flagellar protein FlaG
MSGKVVPTGSAAEALIGTGGRPAEPEVSQVAPATGSDPTDPADLRLIIEEAGPPGNYVYTIVDQRTGKIVSQLPRDEVLRLKEQANYASGSVFNGKA